MTRARAIIATLTLSMAVILGLGAGALSDQDAHLDRLRDQIRGSELRLVAQRHNLGAIQQDLSAAESQLSALAPADAPTAARDARRTVAAAWIGRVNHVRRLFEENPEHRVPYLRLLTDEDWLRATLKLKFDNPGSDRNALSALRMAAAGRYQAPLTRALTRYALANNDAQPASIFMIAPYFENPADAEGLNQFDIVRENGGPWLLKLKIGPDPQNYGSMLVAPNRHEPLGDPSPEK